MSLSVFLFIIGILLLWQGAEYMIKGAVGIARNFDITPLVIGVTVVAFGTTIPEFMVSIIASAQGKPDITVGNIVGSYIANIGLILAATGVIAEIAVEKCVVHKEFPFFIAAPVVLFALAFDGSLSRFDGILLIIIAFIFHFFLIKRIREGKFRRAIEDIAEAAFFKHKLYVPHIMAILFGIAAVILGAHLTVEGGVAVARFVGISEAVIAVTLIAIGTSLPEFFTGVIAAFKKEQGISLGNILGSNILNIFVILGVVIIIAPITSVKRSFILFDIPLMLVL